ncbi:hypothetical protein J42TS3_30530 [Paenibacillus vini]|uniref:Uncharacterized protein n=1 Tax=Paenibacillus vini TaxID=1476024 RepID=A0ABQ4MDE9_9BACL|nr:hypothetical protein J42TS3_30530 [Paenibacillus vini]
MRGSVQADNASFMDLGRGTAMKTLQESIIFDTNIASLVTIYMKIHYFVTL